MQQQHNQLVLLPRDESARRLSDIRLLMQEHGVECIILHNLSNLYYLTGRVYSGYAAVSATEVVYAVRRPQTLEGEGVVGFHKMSQLVDVLRPISGKRPAMELSSMPWALVQKLCEGLGIDIPVAADPLMSQARSVKTPYEIERMRLSGIKQAEAYRRIPRLFRPGMTDIEFQVEIERDSRLAGCLGQFRMSGDDMDLFMGSVLTGDNADTPSPFDFAMGGAGIDPSLPIGANGTEIRPGMPVMVDMNGNYHGYMTDMTRCYCQGTPPTEALRAHRVSIDICRAIAAQARPGVPAASLYELAYNMSAEAGLADCFMGHRSHAGFVGHGIGIDVNEAPVLAPRSRHILQAGNTIAVEPKFVIPGIGPVGIENTYVVRPEGPAQCITILDEEILPLL